MAYPDDIFVPRVTENMPGVEFAPDKKTVLFSEDYQALGSELVAIEETLGTNPEGIFETVRDRLDQMAPSGESVKNIFFDKLVHGLSDWILADRPLQNEVVISFDNQPGAIQGLVLRVTTGPNPVAANITLQFIDGSGNEIIQTIPIDVGPNASVEYFTLSGCIKNFSVVVTDFIGFGALYSLGVDSRFGVPNFPLGADSDILKVMWNGRYLIAYSVEPDFGLVNLFGVSVAPLDSVGILYKPSKPV